MSCRSSGQPVRRRPARALRPDRPWPWPGSPCWRTAAPARSRPTPGRTPGRSRERSGRRRSSGSRDEAGDLPVQRSREPGDLTEHPVPGEEDDAGHHEQLGHKAQGRFLDRGHALEDRDEQAHDEAAEQDRASEGGRHEQGVLDDADDTTLAHRKLTSSECVTNAQPSTRTKSNSLKGKETSVGGSIIMPIDISVALTTRSMTRNGMKMTKPIRNAVLISDRMNAGAS